LCRNGAAGHIGSGIGSAEAGKVNTARLAVAASAISAFKYVHRCGCWRNQRLATPLRVGRDFAWPAREFVNAPGKSRS
jgi:hypothetical protein